MQTCSNCGASVREGARFCTTCGTQLNDASSGSSAFSWGAAIEQNAAPTSEEVTTSWPTVAPTDDTPAEDEPVETESFAWSWGQPDEPLPTEAVDEETGIVLDDPDTTPVEGVVDATELDILVADPDHDPVTVDHETPDLSAMEDEAMASSTDDEALDPDGQDTIAAWAQEWSTVETEPIVDPTPASADEDEDDDPETTVAKAERLIAELQALVPRLARPKPARPNQSLSPQLLADELEAGADGSEWEDLREILTQARDNPNDITYLMNVSGNAGRLLSLMEHRDSLAKTASRVASRLRNPEATDES